MSFVIGLAGGIGCGKSAVADRLVARGAVLIDADVVSREVVAPGGPAYQPLVDRFGPGIVAPDGTVDRPALAAVAFGDPQALADLNAITHPAIGASMVAQREALTATDALVVVAIPLLKTEHRQSVGLDAVVVVDCPVDVALERLVDAPGADPPGRGGPDGGPDEPGGAAGPGGLRRRQRRLPRPARRRGSPAVGLVSRPASAGGGAAPARLTPPRPAPPRYG